MQKESKWDLLWETAQWRDRHLMGIMWESKFPYLLITILTHGEAKYILRCSNTVVTDGIQFITQLQKKFLKLNIYRLVNIDANSFKIFCVRFTGQGVVSEYKSNFGYIKGSIESFQNLKRDLIDSIPFYVMSSTR